MGAFPVPFIDQLLLAAATALNAVGAGGVSMVGSRDVTIYVNTSNGTVSTGAVTIEEADDPAYAGTWSVIQTVTPVQNSNVAVHLSGVYKALRTRVSTALTGGATVSTRIVAGIG